MLDMIRRQILPAVSSYAADLCDRMATLKAAGCVTAYETDTSKEVAVLTDALMKQCQKLAKDMSKVPADPWKAMAYYHKTIIADMDAARKSADALELLVDEQYWPFPVYSDLLFSE